LRALLARDGGFDVEGVVRNLIKDIFVASCAVGASYATALVMSHLGLNGSDVSAKQEGDIFVVEDSGIAAKPAKSGPPSDKFGGNVAMFAGATLIAQKIDPIITHLLQSVVPMLREDTDGLRMTHLRLVEETRSQVEKASTDIQRIVGEMDTAIQCSLVALRDHKSPPGEPASIADAKLWMWARQRFWLGLPDRRRNFFETADMQKVEDLINERPERERMEFGLLMSDIIASSAIGSTGSRLQALLHGEPGTGKTRFAERLAESLQAATILFPESEMQNAMLASHPAIQAKEGKIPGQPAGHEIKFPSIRDAIARAGVTNPLLLFEDFAMKTFESPNVASSLLQFCDPRQNQPFSELILLFTTNDNPYEVNPYTRNQQKAFTNRFQLIEMEELDTATQAKIIDLTLADIVKNARGQIDPDFSTPRVKTPPATVNTPFDGARLLEAIAVAAGRAAKAKPRMLELNTDRGARLIKQVTRQLVNHLSVYSYFGKEVSDETVDQILVLLFTKRRTGMEQGEHSPNAGSPMSSVE
jgi:DNA polymerase III delta prime subunit